MPRLNKQRAHLAKILSVRSNARPAVTEVMPSIEAEREQLNIDLGNGSGEQMLSDTDDSESSPESSSSEEDCEDSDEYSTVDYSETENISATTNSRVTPALKWKERAGKSPKRAYGNGSERTSRLSDWGQSGCILTY
jgi:hypothetical protein